MSFEFTPHPQPFPRWLGPYTRSTGNHSGLRVRQGMIGVWVGGSFWQVKTSPGLQLLKKVVRERWRGGCILILPNGCVVKPLQDEEERGVREYIGLIQGDVVLLKPDGTEFNLRDPGGLSPGCVWEGPTSLGLRCVLEPDASLRCDWYHPTESGREDESMGLTPPDPALARTFQRVRQGLRSGAVRVTENGAVFTSWNAGGRWHCHYLGHVDVSKWPHLTTWISSNSTDGIKIDEVHWPATESEEFGSCVSWEEAFESDRSEDDEGAPDDDDSLEDGEADSRVARESEESDFLAQLNAIAAAAGSPAASPSPAARHVLRAAPDRHQKQCSGDAPDAVDDSISQAAHYWETRAAQEKRDSAASPPPRGFWSWLASLVKGN